MHKAEYNTLLRETQQEFMDHNSPLTDYLSTISVPGWGTYYTIYWFHNDHLGTPQALTDSLKVKRWSGTYKPFGDLSSETVNPVQNNPRFPGQYHDRSTDLYYNLYRHYRPEYGRYQTPDPIGISGGLSLYSYAAQRPLWAANSL
jgi:RHS repeat-associated protein